MFVIAIIFFNLEGFWIKVVHWNQNIIFYFFVITEFHYMSNLNWRCFFLFLTVTSFPYSSIPTFHLLKKNSLTVTTKTFFRFFPLKKCFFFHSCVRSYSWKASVRNEGNRRGRRKKKLKERKSHLTTTGQFHQRVYAQRLCKQVSKAQ